MVISRKYQFNYIGGNAMGNQYSRELPKDALGQKTTAAPREEIHESEWTTPVHLSSKKIIHIVCMN